MGGNQSSKSSIYSTGFRNALNKHLQSYKRKTNNNNEHFEELSIFKSYLSSELNSDQVLYLVYDIFTSLDAFTKHDELSEDLYTSLLANQLLEFDKNDINVTTLQFKEDFHLSLRNLTNELLCFDKENINEEKKTPIKKESAKKIDITTKKTGTIQREYVSNNNRYLDTNSSKNSSNEKPNFKETLNTKKKQENLQNTINPKIDTINSHTNNNIGFDVSGLINEQNKESFTSAQEGFDFNESNMMISKDLFNSNKKNPNYQTIRVNKTNKKPISNSSKQKRTNKTTQNSRKMINNNSSYSSFRINIKDLMKESNLTSMNKDTKKENIENEKNEVNRTFLDCLDKFLDVDKSYLEKKKNQEPKQIKRRFNQYSYFNNINKSYNFTSKYNTIKTTKKPKKVIPPSKSDYYSNLNYINGNVNNKITEESISNTINYGNYISTLSKENKSNTLKTSHSKDNDELDYINHEPKQEDNNFFTPPQDIIHDIIVNSDIHKLNENIISTARPEEHSIEIEGIKKDEEINLTDSEGEEFYSAYSSHQSEAQKEK